MASSATGCGELYQKAVYRDATLTGPASSGDYLLLMTGEQYAGSHDQHRDVAPLFVRLADGTVLDLSALKEKDAAQQTDTVEMDRSGMKLYFLTPSNSTLHFRQGKCVGAVLANDIEIASQKAGPYHTFPLSPDEMRALLGAPLKETTFRGEIDFR